MAFTVHDTKWGFYVTGALPISRMAALMDSVPEPKKAEMLLDVAEYLGATMVIAYDAEAAAAWRAEIQRRLTGGYGEEMTPAKWRAGLDTGISSVTIHDVMVGRRTQRWAPAPPRDPADFGRCYRLLQHFPQWRERLPEVAAAVPAFGPFVECWDEMTALWEEESPAGKCPKLFARMDELQRSVNAAARGEEQS